MTSISERIFVLLKSKHLSQYDLAEYAGLSPAAISSWKSRNTSPSADKLVRISEFLGVSLQFLLTGIDTPDKVPVIMDDGIPYQSSTAVEHELLTLFRQLSDLEKGRILGILEQMTESKTDNH